MAPWSALGPPGALKSYFCFFGPILEAILDPKGHPKSTKNRLFPEKRCCNGYLVICFQASIFFIVFYRFLLYFWKARTLKISDFPM